MKVLFFRSLWGMEEGETLREKFKLIKDAGYDGAEVNTANDDCIEVRDLAQEFDLHISAQIFPMTADELPGYIKKAEQTGALRMTSHSGRDMWEDFRKEAYWKEVLEIQKDCSIPVGHETHRFRIFYAPWETKKWLDKFPDIQVNLDLSHWCVVTETMLHDVEDMVQLAIDRSIHIHSRVGFEEGPQINDPSVPENAHYVERHAEWWDATKKAHEERGEEYLTITPEFGPYPYLYLLPHTKQPVTSLWDTNVWMMNYLKKRWNLK